MNMPFGSHKGTPIERLPCKYLRWLLTIETKPPITTKPEKREQYARERLQLKHDARRILRERALNNVTVGEDGKSVTRPRRRSTAKN